jgi:hypothetical protein
MLGLMLRKLFPNAPEGYMEFEQTWITVRENALEEAGLITLGEGL